MLWRTLRKRGNWLGVPKALAVAAILLIGPVAMARAAEPPPDNVVGPTACAECHKAEAVVWQNARRFTTFHDLPRAPKADEITKKLGITRIKTEPLCLSCHFTQQIKDGAAEPVAGISCKSCHGPGKGYMKVHSSFSGKKKETKSPAEAAKRWANWSQPA